MFIKRLDPNRIFADRLFPKQTGQQLSQVSLYPRHLYTGRLYPPRLYPYSVNTLVFDSIYNQILQSVVNMIQSVYPTVCQPSQVMLTIHPEPYPIWDGPAAFVMPGAIRSIDGQAYGDGRYFHGFEGNFTVRFMDRSFKDRAFSNQLMLTDSSTNPNNITKTPFYPSRLYPSRLYPLGIYSFTGTAGDAVKSAGILRNADSLIDNLHLRFAASLVDNSVLTEEPIVLESQTFGLYRGASEWGYTDLNFKIKFYQPYIFDVLPDFPSNATASDPQNFFSPSVFPENLFPDYVYTYFNQRYQNPVNSNLSDVLLSIQSKIISNGIFTQDQSQITLQEEIYPLVSGPFCSILPEEFSMQEGDVYGAGRAFSIMTGTIRINAVANNISDVSGQATQALTNPSVSLGLLTLVEQIQEYLDVSFLYNQNNSVISVEPVFLQEIGKPFYYGGEARSGQKSAANYVGIPLTFLVKYAQNLTQNPSWGPA